jgi:hypothetical protein
MGQAANIFASLRAETPTSPAEDKKVTDPTIRRVQFSSGPKGLEALRLARTLALDELYGVGEE